MCVCEIAIWVSHCSLGFSKPHAGTRPLRHARRANAHSVLRRLDASSGDAAGAAVVASRRPRRGSGGWHGDGTGDGSATRMGAAGATGVTAGAFGADGAAGDGMDAAGTFDSTGAAAASFGDAEEQSSAGMWAAALLSLSVAVGSAAAVATGAVCGVNGLPASAGACAVGFFNDGGAGGCGSLVASEQGAAGTVPCLGDESACAAASLLVSVGTVTTSRTGLEAPASAGLATAPVPAPALSRASGPSPPAWPPPSAAAAAAVASAATAAAPPPAPAAAAAVGVGSVVACGVGAGGP